MLWTQERVGSLGEYETRPSRGKRLRLFADGVVNWLFPPRSIATGEHLAGPGQVEPEVWRQLHFISAPICRSCGVPLDPAVHLHDDQETDCAACIANPPIYDAARAALIYDDVSRNIVLRLKHGGDRSGLKLMARWMITSAPEIVKRADIVTPVPLHYLRLQSRGFNQSLLLAAAIAGQTELTLSPHMIKRKRSTPSQAGRSVQMRRRNVAGAFVMSMLGKRTVKNCHILLIDDVFTTGATVEACAKLLKKAGAKEVSVLTLARVARPSDPTI